MSDFVLPDAELRETRPKVFRARAGVISGLLAVRTLVTLLAVFCMAAGAYHFWHEARAAGKLMPWLYAAGCGSAALAFAWSLLHGARQMISHWGAKVTLDHQGILFERRGRRCHCSWDNLERVEHDDRLSEGPSRPLSPLHLFQHYVGGLLFSKLKVRSTDGQLIIVTPVYERYGELCRRVQREYKCRLVQ